MAAFGGMRLAIWARAGICLFSLALWSIFSLAQAEPSLETAKPTLRPAPSSTQTPRDAADNSLQAPRLLRAAMAESYAPRQAEAVGPLLYPSGINPLTGLPYPHEEARMRRNLIVKVSNWPPKVRPQHAINQADLVYEMESEGGVTRFAALFRNNSPEKVGSVRSARLVDMELLTMYAALLAYSGTSEPVQNILRERINRYLLLSPSLGDNCEQAGFCRDQSVIDRGYEHTLFGNTQAMWNAASRRNINIGFRATGFAFALQPDEGGSDINDVYIDWYSRTNTRWQYDADSQRYLRFADGEPHLDAADGTQLWADNLIMLGVTHNRRLDLFEAGALNESYEVALWGQGQALVLRDGKLYRGSWHRHSHNRGAALSLAYSDGRPIMLKPGRSWVTVMRSLDGVVLSNAPAASAKAQS